MSKPNRRFSPTRWTEYLVPVLLVLLGIFLLATLAVIMLSIAGLTPGA